MSTWRGHAKFRVRVCVLGVAAVYIELMKI